MKIDFVKVVSNLMNDAELSVEDIRNRAHVRKDRAIELCHGNECELNHVEEKMLVKLHFAECKHLHSEIIK